MKRFLSAVLFVFMCIFNTSVLHAANNCTGATYYDSDSDTCIACPTGYDYNTDAGKTSITQCQIHCDAGTYVGTGVIVGYTQLEYIESTGIQYIDTGITATSDMKWVLDNEFTAIPPSSGRFANGLWQYYDSGAMRIFIDLLASGPAMSYGAINEMSASTSNFVNQRMTYVIDAQSMKWSYGNTEGAFPSYNQYHDTSNTMYLFARQGSNGAEYYSKQKTYSSKFYRGSALIQNLVPARRNSDGVIGMYDTVSGTFFTNSGTGTFIAGSDVGPIGGQCVNVGAGYYVGASTVNYGSVGTRSACPVGLTTVGYGRGADSANDCGRKLHVGDSVVYMRQNKETTPSLNFQMPNGDRFYVSLSPSNHTMSKLHFWYNNAGYTAYDDSLFYGERNFETGVPITQ